MTNPVNFFSKALQDQPFEAYQHLRQDAPVYQDPSTRIFHVSRFEDVRHVLQNPTLFSGKTRSAQDRQTERQARVEILDCPEEAWCGEQDAFQERKDLELQLLDEVLPQFQLRHRENTTRKVGN